jgi:hypothetical protein
MLACTRLAKPQTVHLLLHCTVTGGDVSTAAAMDPKSATGLSSSCPTSFMPG